MRKGFQLFLLFIFIIFTESMMVAILPPLFIFGFLGTGELLIFALILAYMIKYRGLSLRKMSFKLLAKLYLITIVANAVNSLFLLLISSDYSLDEFLKILGTNFFFGAVILVVIPVGIMIVFSKISDSFYYWLLNKRYIYVEIIALISIALIPFLIYQYNSTKEQEHIKTVTTEEKEIFSSTKFTNQINTKLKFKVWNYIWKNQKYKNEDVKFYLAYYDLNSDGTPEAYIYLQSKSFCSNATCRVLAYELITNKGFKVETQGWQITQTLPMASKTLYFDTNISEVVKEKEHYEVPAEVHYKDTYTKIWTKKENIKQFIHYRHNYGDTRMLKYLKYDEYKFNKFEKIEFKDFNLMNGQYSDFVRAIK